MAQQNRGPNSTNSTEAKGDTLKRKSPDYGPDRVDTVATTQVSSPQYESNHSRTNYNDTDAPDIKNLIIQNLCIAYKFCVRILLRHQFYFNLNRWIVKLSHSCGLWRTTPHLKAWTTWSHQYLQRGLRANTLGIFLTFNLSITYYLLLYVYFNFYFTFWNCLFSRQLKICPQKEYQQLDYFSAYLILVEFGEGDNCSRRKIKVKFQITLLNASERPAKQHGMFRFQNSS